MLKNVTQVKIKWLFQNKNQFKYNNKTKLFEEFKYVHITINNVNKEINIVIQHLIQWQNQKSMCNNIIY